MLTEKARVIRRDGKRVELELLRANACGGCELSQGCGTGALGRLLGKRSRSLVIETDADCQAGEEVSLDMPESTLVKTSLLLYGLPLLGLVLAAAIAAMLALGEALVVIAALGGLFAGFRIAASMAKKLEHGGGAPYISKIRVNPTPPLGS